MKQQEKKKNDENENEMELLNRRSICPVTNVLYCVCYGDFLRNLPSDIVMGVSCFTCWFFRFILSRAISTLNSDFISSWGPTLADRWCSNKIPFYFEVRFVVYVDFFSCWVNELCIAVIWKEKKLLIGLYVPDSVLLLYNYNTHFLGDCYLWFEINTIFLN